MQINVNLTGTEIEISSLTEKDFAPQINIMVGITDPKPIIFPMKFKYGYQLALGNEVIFEKTYLPLGSEYISTDQDILSSDIIFGVEPEKDYYLHVWALSGVDYFDKTVTFTMNNNGRPFQSWEYDAVNRVWLPPIPYPEDELDYIWDELTRTWLPFVDE